MTRVEAENALSDLYADFAAAGLMPLWTQRAGLMRAEPAPAARPHLWRWEALYPLAARAGDLVPVGRGGERRAIALANPGLPGQPYATPTLWAAIQYLGPRELAPAHRHAQTAFRFVLQGEGVWTVVDGDAVEMRRGDLLLTPGWAWHEHHNTTAEPMAWLDGLDIPLVSGLDAGFFEFGPDELTDTSTPPVSRSEQLWAHPGLRPVASVSGPAITSPLVAYRWAHTDAALSAQLELEEAGHPATVSQGHAAVRFSNPATGGDALITLRTEMHRVRADAATTKTRAVGSSVWQVFEGTGTVVLDDAELTVGRGDVFAVPSWCHWQVRATTTIDLFAFSDAPVYEKLGLTGAQRGTSE